MSEPNERGFRHLSSVNAWELALQIVAELSSPTFNDESVSHISFLLGNFSRLLINEHFTRKLYFGNPLQLVNQEELDEEFRERYQVQLESFIFDFWNQPKEQLFDQIRVISANKKTLSQGILTASWEEDLTEDAFLHAEFALFASANEILQGVLNRALLASTKEYPRVESRIRTLRQESTVEEREYLDQVRAPENMNKWKIEIEEQEQVNPELAKKTMDGILELSKENVLCQKVITTLLKHCEEFKYEITVLGTQNPQVEAVENMERILLNTHFPPKQRLAMFHHQLDVEKTNALKTSKATNAPESAWAKFLKKLDDVLSKRLNLSFRKHLKPKQASHTPLEKFVAGVAQSGKDPIDTPQPHLQLTT